MSDPKLEPLMWERIGNWDYEAVFAYGGCFHFALRLHERFEYPLRGCCGHVWAKKGNDGIDIRGVYPEQLLSRLANGGRLCAGADVQPEQASAAIKKKEFSDKLTNELFRLADWIVDTHERFQPAKHA